MPPSLAAATMVSWAAPRRATFMRAGMATSTGRATTDGRNARMVTGPASIHQSEQVTSSGPRRRLRMRSPSGSVRPTRRRWVSSSATEALARAAPRELKTTAAFSGGDPSAVRRAAIAPVNAREVAAGAASCPPSGSPPARSRGPRHPGHRGRTPEPPLPRWLRVAGRRPASRSR